MERIEGFQGEFRWLSNFWLVEVELDGVIYPSTEHAYQAAKSEVPEYRQSILECKTPGKAKRLSRGIILRDDWDQIKVQVMEDLLRQKFRKGTELGDKLLATGEVEIEETNTWGDTFYGVCKGQGQNILGKLLMQIRKELQES